MSQPVDGESQPVEPLLYFPYFQIQPVGLSLQPIEQDNLMVPIKFNRLSRMVWGFHSSWIGWEWQLKSLFVFYSLKVLFNRLNSAVYVSACLLAIEGFPQPVGSYSIHLIISLGSTGWDLKTLSAFKPNHFCLASSPLLIFFTLHLTYKIF